MITGRYDWFDESQWAMAVVAAGLAVLVAGYGLDTLNRRRSG